MQLADILRTALETDASDIHLVSGQPPMMRVHTVITPMDYPVLTPEFMTKTLESITNETQRRMFGENMDLDFSFEVPGLQQATLHHRWQQALRNKLRQGS